MSNVAVKLDADLRIENIIAVETFIPEGYQLVGFPVRLKQTLSEAQDDYASTEARALRDSLLAATDWTANSDVTMSDEMRTYRQALRDVPSQAGFPNDVTWPVKP